ncbi:hypothetical protein N9P66_03145 [Salibacteraceae bacterium]|nr:hypothetical protein [Salibacteraceae bacterium]
MWAFPGKDEHVKALYNELKSSFDNPRNLKDFIDSSFTESTSYAAVFVPGGHGAMIGIPEDENVGKILNWAHENDLFTISLCHGPGSFLSTTLNGQEFLYKGYDVAVFPDAVDEQTPMIGYLPGNMPSGLSEKLKSLGANIVNTESDKTVVVDRKLITGASPLASNELGKLAANTLLKELKKNHLLKRMKTIAVRVQTQPLFCFMSKLLIITELTIITLLLLYKPLAVVWTSQKDICILD